MNYNKKGFTLAETLITLVIIGVVAALTVPTMIIKYQKEQTVTRLKKTYSALSQTTARAIADYGPINTWEVGPNLKSESAAEFTKKYMEPYLNLMKPTTLDDAKWITMYLNDGTRVKAAMVNQLNNKRLQVNVFVQSHKNLSKPGRDGFEFSYYLYYMVDDVQTPIIGKLIPYGAWNTREELLSDSQYMCNKNQNMAGCSALIMKDGWQIKDDYPW